MRCLFGRKGNRRQKTPWWKRFLSWCPKVLGFLPLVKWSLKIEEKISIYIYDFRKMVQAGKKINQPEFCGAGPNQGGAQASLASSPVHVSLATWHHHSRAGGLVNMKGEESCERCARAVCCMFSLRMHPSSTKGGAWGDFSLGPKNSSRDETTQKPLTIHDRHHQPLTVGTMPGTTEYEPERQGLLLVAWNTVSQLTRQDVWCFWAICETLHQLRF